MFKSLAYSFEGIGGLYNGVVSFLQGMLESVLYIEVLHVPFIILWIMLFGAFCTVRFKFVNVRLFGHAFMVLIGKYGDKQSKGAITHLQAFFTSISGTVGLGTISGVAIAITLGGPGAIFWMALIGVLGMSIKFAEVILAFKYRVYSGAEVRGGPFEYMRLGLAELGYKRLGRILAAIYSVMLIIAMVFGGIPFQANQTVVIFHNLLPKFNISLISITLSLLVGLVIIGGISRIARITTAIAPTMTILYIIGCSIILIIHKEKLGEAFVTIFTSAFQGTSFTGGMMACMIAGVRRSVFANEAGIGTAAIAHSATKDTNAVRAGCSAMLEPCVDTILISCLTGIMIVVVGDYHGVSGDIMLASRAFLGISPLFGNIIFPIIVFSFAFSTIIAYSYYCEIAWIYLVGSRRGLCWTRLLVVFLVFCSGLFTNVAAIAGLGDLLFMCLSIPNSIAVCVLSNIVAKELFSYTKTFKGLTHGEF